MKYSNQITLVGIVSKVLKKGNSIWFDICQNNKFKNNNGEQKIETSYFSARIDNERYKKFEDLIQKGKLIYIYGYPKSYVSNNIKKFYVNVIDVIDLKKENDVELNITKENNVVPNISYDMDNIMLWNGKRCEVTPCTDEEQQEMDEIIKSLL